MRSRFNSDLQDDFDVFDTLGSTIGASFSTQAGEDRDSRSGNQPVELLGTPPLTSEAALALGSQSGGTAAVTTLTAGGITINLLFDAAATAAPASFRAAITQAASLLTAAISDQITVNIKIDYSGSGGGAAGGPDNGQYLGYSTGKDRSAQPCNARRCGLQRLAKRNVDPGPSQRCGLECPAEAVGVDRRQRQDHR